MVGRRRHRRGRARGVAGHARAGRRRARDDRRAPPQRRHRRRRMRAMVLDGARRAAARRPSCRRPEPGPGQVLLRVAACGVCRTDLHVVDGELPDPKLPLVLGHQIVGETRGRPAARRARGSAGRAASAATAERAREPLRRAPASPATTSTAATPSGPSPTSASASRSPSGYGDLEAAPLLCAGLIGYRALRLAGDARAARALRLRRGGAHRRAGRALGRAAASSRSRAPGDEQAQAVRPLARRRVGRRRRRRPRSSTPRSSSRRPASSSPRRSAPSRRAAPSSAPGSTCRDIPLVPVRAPLGRAGAPLGREPDPPRRRGVPRARAADPGAHDGRGVPARAGERGAREAPRG